VLAVRNTVFVVMRIAFAGSYVVNYADAGVGDWQRAVAVLVV